MIFSQAIARLGRLSGRPGPRIVSVEGRLGLSPLAPVLKATEGRRRVVFASPELTDDENFGALRARLTPHARWEQPPAEWSHLFGQLSNMDPLALIIEDPAGVVAANRRFWPMLGEGWCRVRRRGSRIHLFLVTCERGLGRELNRPDSPLRSRSAGLRSNGEPDPVDVVEVEVGSHYDLGRAVPRWRGPDLFLGWALFGGLPARWTTIGPEGGPVACLRRILECPPESWVSGPMDLLRQAVTRSNRYATILRAVAKGAQSRGAIAAALSASFNRGIAGPYLSRLRSLGLLTADRPLGSTSGRRSRYRLSDPHERFWWSRVHPLRSDLLVSGFGAEAWTRWMEPALTPVLLAAMPEICRNFLRFGCVALLGASAREAGPLWGPGFDFPVAAVLYNGAVCYGHIHPGPGPAPPAALRNLERQVRVTRYGFGRQARVLLLFSLTGFHGDLRRTAARNPLVRLIGGTELAAQP